MLPTCGIPNCGEQSKKLVFASPPVLTYYGFKNRLEIVKVCPSCLGKAEEFEKKSVDLVKSRSCLFSIPHEPQRFPEPNGSLNEKNEKDDGLQRELLGGNGLVEVDLDRGDVEGLVQSIMTKFDIKSQVEQCVETICNNVSELEADMSQLQKDFDSTQDVLFETVKQYNKMHGQAILPLVTQEVEINADGSVRSRNVDSDETSVFANTKALYRQSMESKRDEDNGEQKANDNNDQVKLPVPEPGGRKKLLPIPRIIPRVRPRNNEIVYAMRKNLLNSWQLAEVIDSTKNEHTHQDELVIRYELNPGSIEGGPTLLVRQVCLRELAYREPMPFYLPVGTRIIAKYNDEPNPSRDVHGKFYAGVIAEPAKPMNGDRYLIFFDDGFAQYIPPDDVLLVCECSQQVWNDVHPDSYDFIKEYLTKYPEWPRLKITEGDMVPTEWHGAWLISRVVKVDNSMVKVKFEYLDHEEWIYRGSPRFRKIYDEIVAEAKGKENDPGRTIPHRQSSLRDDDHLVVYGNDYDFEDSNSENHVFARKSTARSPRKNPDQLVPNEYDFLTPDHWREYQGKLTVIKIPKDAPKPAEYVPHDCSSKCVQEGNEFPLNKFKSRSPLAIPLFLGWEREVGTYPQEAVFYRAPCGVRLRTITELRLYLKSTGSLLPIDCFSFDHSVNALNEFVPENVLSRIEDMSFGKERVPISCVNSVDHDTLPYMEYSAKPIPMEDVSYQKDKGFLSCCDCTDDCEDKSKCACWKLTMEGISFTKFSRPENPIQGYAYKKLKDHIVSGIYECNSKCQCKNSCSNRLVQNGIMWPLQLFKTTRKGWGIRTLYDIPEGTFVCIYAGRIFTEQYSRELMSGDEYFAELDFIEVNEGAKAGYESDVTDIEEDDDFERIDDDRLSSPRHKKVRLEGENENDNGSQQNPESIMTDNDVKEEGDVNQDSATPKSVRLFPVRRTGGYLEKPDSYLSRVEGIDGFVDNDDDALTGLHSPFIPKIAEGKRKEKRYKGKKLREYFGGKDPFIMDAKLKGNIGRYLNHSCRPNIFVQNVFVETHDLRFPLVAFFTNCCVRAGSELTWDYHYEIGSVAGKKMYCYCMTPYCRGRLL